MRNAPRSEIATLLDRVVSALRATFGPAQIRSIEPVSGGASGACPFRAEVGDRRCLVRLEGPASPLRNPHQYDSMKVAAEAGIAPRLYHVDEAARVAVMDFVDELPLETFPGGASALAGEIGKLVARVQATPRFQTFVEYPDMVSRLWQWACRTGLFAPGVLDPYTERLDALRRAHA